VAREAVSSSDTTKVVNNDNNNNDDDDDDNLIPKVKVLMFCQSVRGSNLTPE